LEVRKLSLYVQVIGIPNRQENSETIMELALKRLQVLMLKPL